MGSSSLSSKLDFLTHARLLALLGACLIIATPSVAQTAAYRLTVDNTWSEASHPGAFPSGAHFSWLAGGTHSSGVSFWNEGVLASPGIVQMAETGFTYVLVDEVEAAIAADTAHAALSWQYWFCPSATTNPSCGPLVVEFEVDEDFPLVTLTSMIGPSPDWFIGVSGLPLHDGTEWLDLVVVDLYPYDGGTRDLNVFLLGGPLTMPPDPVSLITTASGQIIGPGSLGTFTFERIIEDFVRGDVNADGSFGISDVMDLLGSLFMGSGAPPCEDAADTNDDGLLDVSDPVSALAILFLGAPGPPAPFPDCASDPSFDTLTCGAFAGCP